MQLSRFFLSPLQSGNHDFGDDNGDDASGLGPNDFRGEFSLPHIQHVMQVYMLPPSDREQSPWKVAGMAMLLVTALLAFLLIAYYCAKRCCCTNKKTLEAEDAENAEETPSRANDEHRVSLPSELPSIEIDAPVKTTIPAAFLESPTLNVSQPYQPEPEDLAKMQEQMLKQLETTNVEWEMGHDDHDKKPFY